MSPTTPGTAAPGMPTRRGYVIAAVIAVASIAIVAALIVSIVRSASDYELTPISQGDTITVGEERQALFAQLPSGADPADNFFCTVTRGDQWEYASASGSMQINSWSRVGVTPDDLPPGDYVVGCSGLPLDVPMAVGDQPDVGGYVAKGVTAGVIGIVGPLVALALVIITAVRRSVARRPPRPGPRYPPAPPSQGPPPGPPPRPR